MAIVASGSQLQVALENVQTSIDGGDAYAKFGEYAKAIAGYRTAGEQLTALGFTSNTITQLAAASGNTQAASDSARALAIAALAATKGPTSTPAAATTTPSSSSAGAVIAVVALLALGIGVAVVSRRKKR